MEVAINLILNLLLLVLGFVFLVKGADIFVDGSSSIAKILKIPAVIVGVTVVSMGTSLPELAVSTTAAMRGANEIALSNVVGSNTFNFMVVLGMTAVLAKTAVPVKKSLLKVEFPLGLVMVAVLGLMSCDLLFKGGIFSEGNIFSNANAHVATGSLGRTDGIILLIVFVLYMAYTVKAALSARRDAKELENEGREYDEIEEEIKEEDEKELKAISKKLDQLGKAHPVILALVYIVLGVVLIKFGGDFVVRSATFIASTCGMSQTLIGLTIVALGTSLPELVTSVVAARKDECDLAVGNVVGSNLFNILLILGVSSTIHPIMIFSASVVDIIVLFFTSLIGTLFCLGKRSVNRLEGFSMVAIYVVYLIYIIIR